MKIVNSEGIEEEKEFPMGALLSIIDNLEENEPKDKRSKEWKKWKKEINSYMKEANTKWFLLFGKKHPLFKLL